LGVPRTAGQKVCLSLELAARASSCHHTCDLESPGERVAGGESSTRALRSRRSRRWFEKRAWCHGGPSEPGPRGHHLLMVAENATSELWLCGVPGAPERYRSPTTAPGFESAAAIEHDWLSAPATSSLDHRDARSGQPNPPAGGVPTMGPGGRGPWCGWPRSSVVIVSIGRYCPRHGSDRHR